jgi:hypothetical protein
VGDGRTDGDNFEHLETELALGHFLQRDVHEGAARIDDDERAEALPELAMMLTKTCGLLTTLRASWTRACFMVRGAG